MTKMFLAILAAVATFAALLWFCYLAICFVFWDMDVISILASQTVFDRFVAAIIFAPILAWICFLSVVVFYSIQDGV